jgi:predicted esterase YcpF (UPF0227 family)
LKIQKKPLDNSKGFLLIQKGRTDILIYRDMKCKYRNCKNEVIGRPNKKFSKIQCKRNELKYKQRKKKYEKTNDL